MELCCSDSEEFDDGVHENGGQNWDSEIVVPVKYLNTFT